MKKISLFFAIIFSLAIFLSACSGSKAPNASYDSESYQGYDKPMEMPSADGMVADKSEVGNYGNDIYASDSNKIIRTASITIQTTEFDKSVDALNKLTSDLGGYFESAQVEGGGIHNKYASRTAYYIVRIPKENFITFRDGTSGIGHVYSISEESQDVGETYYDTEARLQTLTTKRERLLALLEKAEFMEDIITLENALADVQYQIDKHTATLRKYDSLIGYSTFSIRMNEVIEIREEPGVSESFGSRLLSSLKTGFANFGEGLQDFALWFARNLIGIIIFVAVVVIAVLCGKRLIRRRRAKKNNA